MRRIIDLSQLSRNELLAIKTVLQSGTVATAETKKAKRLRESEAEVIRLKKVAERKGVCESAGIEWQDGDDEYYGSMSDENFLKTIQMFVLTKKGAVAEASLRGKFTFNIPNLRGRDEELEGSKYIAEQLKLRKNGDKG